MYWMTDGERFAVYRSRPDGSVERCTGDLPNVDGRKIFGAFEQASPREGHPTFKGDFHHPPTGEIHYVFVYQGTFEITIYLASGDTDIETFEEGSLVCFMDWEVEGAELDFEAGHCSAARGDTDLVLHKFITNVTPRHITAGAE